MAEEGGAPAIEGLLETSLYARDLRRTAAFYRDLFGLKALVDSPRLVAFEIARAQRPAGVSGRRDRARRRRCGRHDSRPRRPRAPASRALDQRP